MLEIRSGLVIERASHTSNIGPDIGKITESPRLMDMTDMELGDGASLSERISAIFSIGGDEEAIEYDELWWSWNALSRVGDEIASLIDDAGMSPDSGVALLVRNRPAVAAAILGRLASNRGYISINGMLPDKAVLADLNRVRHAVVVGTAEDLNRSGLVRAETNHGALVLELPVHPNEPVKVVATPSKGQEDRSPADRLKSGSSDIDMTTSGTTGRAKRIRIRQEHLLATVLEAQQSSGAGTAPVTRLHSGVSIAATPLSHIGGIFGLLMTVTQGRKLVLLDRFDAHKWSDLVERHRVIAGSLPPAAIRMVLDAGIPKSRLRSLKVISTGTAPLPRDLAERFEATYEIPLLQAYGATEFAGGLSSFTYRDYKKWGDRKRDSVGRPHPGVEFRIVDPDTRAILGPDEIGILEVRTGHNAVSNDAGTFTSTNDLARLDSDGYLYIHGRADDVIIRGGFKIDLGRLEDTLRSHPEIHDAGAVALSDERLGKVPIAGVVLEPGSSLSVDEIRRHVKDNLAPYAVPTRIALLPELPRNSTLKVLRPALTEMILREGS